MEKVANEIYYLLKMVKVGIKYTEDKGYLVGVAQGYTQALLHMGYKIGWANGSQVLQKIEDES